MTPTANGMGESFSNYAQTAELRHGEKDPEPSKRELALISKMGPVTRGGCMVAGDGQITGLGSATKIMQVLHDYPAPEGVDAIYYEVARFPAIWANRQNYGRIPSSFRLTSPRSRVADADGGSFPETCVSMLQVQDASLPWSYKSLVSASVQGNLGMSAAAGPTRR